MATIGITDFAQGELGDIVYVEVETVDEELDAEEVFGTVEAVKTVSDLFMPIAGEVLEFNESLESNPEKVNEDPYGEGWMIKVKIADSSAVASLLEAGQYEELIDRLKSNYFIAFLWSLFILLVCFVPSNGIPKFSFSRTFTWTNGFTFFCFSFNRPSFCS